MVLLRYPGNYKLIISFQGTKLPSQCDESHTQRNTPAGACRGVSLTHKSLTYLAFNALAHLFDGLGDGNADLLGGIPVTDGDLAIGQ